ncbi:MAG: hypothetical protein JKY54_02585 [Flavobacteriales bacterium]|nr:hypothetical protein [Flavobacteriales bacterium]
MQKGSLFLLITILFSSCFIIEEYENATVVENKIVKASRQDELQDSVTVYLSKQYEGESKYLLFTFGAVFANKPQPIVELVQLYDLKKALPGMQAHYGDKLDSVRADNDTAIVHKQNEIREQRIYATYDLTHLYCVENKKEKTVKVIETKVLAYPNNKIKDMQLIFQTKLDEREFELFEYFIHQDPLYFSTDYSYQSQMNAAAYKKMNQALMDEPSATKADLLKTILQKVQFYQQNNGFDSDLFTNKVLSKWSKTPTLDVKIKKIIKTSKLIPIKGKTKATDGGVSYEYLIGYKKFILIDGLWDEDYQEEKAVYCEFDKNHVLKGVLLVEGEHEKYFE